MSAIYPHQMFQADFLVMFQEVQRQEKIGPYHSDETEFGKEIFFFFGEDVLPLVLKNDWVYEAAKRFATEYADEYFIRLRLLGSVKENQKHLTKLREEITRLIKEAIVLKLAPDSVNITKLSDFTKVINIDKLPSTMKQRANKLLDEAIEFELLYVNVASQAMQELYEKGLPRIFYVVKRALKIQIKAKPTSADDTLQDAHQYLDWCSHHLPLNHILSKTLVEHRKFYKVVRNVDSHVTGPKWQSETDVVYLPDREIQPKVNITDFSKRYRYLMYFCEIGARGILAAFCDRDRGAISNNVKSSYLKLFDNPELKENIRDYPLKS
jgi:hypothetical protein